MVNERFAKMVVVGQLTKKGVKNGEHNICNYIISCDFRIFWLNEMFLMWGLLSNYLK